MADVECEVCGQTLPPGTGWPEYCQHIETLHPDFPLGNPRRRLFPLGDEDGEDTQVVEKDPVDMSVEEDEGEEQEDEEEGEDEEGKEGEHVEEHVEEHVDELGDAEKSKEGEEQG